MFEIDGQRPMRLDPSEELDLKYDDWLRDQNPEVVSALLMEMKRSWIWALRVWKWTYAPGSSV